jgi:hypothetical protein
MGWIADFGDSVPEEKTNENSVRAEFLRFFLLGGDEQAPVYERGVLLQGAYIEGKLDLGACRISGFLIFTKCFFSKGISAQDARIAGVFSLAGSHLMEGFQADRLECAASLFLRKGFKGNGQITLSGAQIGGDLDFIGGSLESDETCTLNLERVNVKGNIFLSDNFSAKGLVRLVAVKIGGSISCNGGRFEVEAGDALSADGADISGDFYLSGGFKAMGEVRLLGAKIGGDLVCEGGHFLGKEEDALCLQSTVVQGRWFLRDLPSPVRANASHAEVSVLVDDLTAWADGSSLDGFRYHSLGGQASTSGKDRIAWLLKQPEKHRSTEEFRPQPWRQLQRVLREMGHSEDAKQVGIAFEDHLRKIDRMGKLPNDPSDLVCGFKGIVTRTAHYMFGKLAGYGYRPVDLVMWMLGVWLACGGIYRLAQSPFNVMAPSDPLVFQDARYSECRPTQEKQPDSAEKEQGKAEQSEKVRTIGNWPLCSDMPGEYSTFSPWAYSLDLLLPVVDLGQEKSWGAYIPSPNEGAADESILNWRWGYFVRFVTWFETLFGWVSSLLLVAIISGFSRRNDEG